MADAEEAPDEAPEAADYDAEIAGIFSEEAAELLDAADQAVAAWVSDKSSRAPVDELKRHLHTLKAARAWPESWPWVT